MSTEITPKALEGKFTITAFDGEKSGLPTVELWMSTSYVQLTNNDVVELVDCLVRWQIKHGFVKL